MDKYIQFPRYSIFLIPNQEFEDHVNDLLFKNNIIFDKLKISKYGLHYTVKAPFYLSHLYNEKNLIDSFATYFSLNKNYSYREKFNISGPIKYKNSHALEIFSNEKFDFFCNDIVRYFDIFRKTLNLQEIKIDLKRFDNLSTLEMEYYLIWGYPYLFEFKNHHISISDNLKELTYDNNINSLKFSKISLMKQDNTNGKFYSICYVD